MPIIFNRPEDKNPQVKPKTDYIWDRNQRKLIKKDEQEVILTKDNHLSKPDMLYKREVPSKEPKKHSEHYIKVEDGSLHKFYNTKSQYLKDMADLNNL